MRTSLPSELLFPAAHVYVSAPYSGDTAANLARARRWVAALREQFPVVHFYAPWIGLGEALPHLGYEHALRVCYAWIADVDAVWLVGGRISRGMQLEAEYARTRCIRVRDLTSLGDEPPDQVVFP